MRSIRAVLAVRSFSSDCYVQAQIHVMFTCRKISVAAWIGPLREHCGIFTLMKYYITILKGVSDL